MIKKRFSLLVIISLLLAANAGLSLAQDTGTPHTHNPAGTPHTHDPAIDGVGSSESWTDGFHARLSESMPPSSMPMAFLVIPIGGEYFPFHWLWQFLKGLPDDDHSLLTHEFKHWHDIPHSHKVSASEGEGDLSDALTQLD